MAILIPIQEQSACLLDVENNMQINTKRELNLIDCVSI